MATMDSTQIYSLVNERYGATARAKHNASYGSTVATAFGYSPEELASVPAESNLGVSCGNPIAVASIKTGETVVDLGSGAGFDVFLAARKVGPTGRAIGVDMNDDMLAKARLNASKSNAINATFVKSQITDINLPDASADVVISNCVINLVPEVEKAQVFHEVFRILKPGGRLAVSDILAKKEFTEKMRQDVALYMGCIAGASKKKAYEVWMREAGFEDITVVDAKSDLNIYTQTDGEEEILRAGCCGNGKEVKKEKTGCCVPKKETPSSCCAPKKEVPACCVESVGDGKDDVDVVNAIKASYKDVNLNEWAGSYKIFAVKPMKCRIEGRYD